MMMKTLVVCAVISLLSVAGCAERFAEPRHDGGDRVGVYDSRAIAVAFPGTDIFKREMAVLTAAHEAAKLAGDEKEIAEIEEKGASRQKLMHRQAFSTAPVDDILDRIKDLLPAIRETAGVSMLVSKWDEDVLAQYPSAPRVDVTMALIDALAPREKQRKYAIEIQSRKPIPLDKLERADH